MEKFFTDKKAWPGSGPYPHVLVLLGRFPELRTYASAHHELLSQYAEQLAVIPEEWLHSTVQGVHHAVDAGLSRKSPVSSS